MKGLLCDSYRFNSYMKPALTAAAVDGPWTKADTSAAGAPTLATVGGYMEAALEATNEVQNLCMYHGDVLSYDIDDLVRVEFFLKITASLNAAISAAFGMASARNDDIDTIARHASFRCIGSNAVVCESDDATNDKDDIATGLTLPATERRFVIDFKEGVNTVSGGLSTGGKSNVIFSMEDSRGNLRRVCEGTRFNMENYTGGLQPYFQIQKTAAAAVATLAIRGVDVHYRRAA